ncbi:hypothetical protein L1987_41362 [Smallanthus sonchifolius]|uniref:Uncharacterized protein n=1 Tax=Smallanthus sonchifolius TaxID=185202 RepID=A0ACB9GW01_9ASTR|nr:hypothetical protein L1987_41362 [Smallanthus sonchifolius]
MSGNNQRNQRRRVQRRPPSVDLEDPTTLVPDPIAPSPPPPSPASPPPPLPSPPPPPPQRHFMCPICMGPLVEMTSTSCGHLFCDICIRTALSVQPKCPLCRRDAIQEDLFRIYLSAPYVGKP